MLKVLLVLILSFSVVVVLDLDLATGLKPEIVRPQRRDGR